MSYQSPTTSKPLHSGTKVPNSAYISFCGSLVNIFDKDWKNVKTKLDTSWPFLEHIPDNAWHPMLQLAVDRWESWPRNWVKAVREVYSTWQTDTKTERSTTDCEYCNGNGFFSGIKRLEVKPWMTVAYRYTYRCKSCRNWFGVIGKHITEAYPLEVKSDGFLLDIYEKPMPTDAKRISLTELVASVGQQVNQPKPRPAVQRFDDEIPF